MSHNVTITRLPDETTDDYEYEFGGTHGRDCEVWLMQVHEPNERES